MNSQNMPDLVIIAGPNGSGKSTVAEFLKENNSLITYMNADVIAQGLSIHTVSNSGEVQAGKVMISSLRKAISNGRDVSFETTMAGRSWVHTLHKAKALGYHTTICFIVVNSPALAIQRVQQRVSEGGHDIPKPTITRRYKRSLEMFFSIYHELADTWYFFDNSDISAKMIAKKEDGQITIYDEDIFALYGRITKKS